MIVFDVFIDIESTHEFSDLFFQIFMISIEKSGPVKVEVTVVNCCVGSTNTTGLNLVHT